MSILSVLSRNGPTGFGYSSTAEDVTAGLSLAGKTILVTGCNSGLGLEAMRGARVARRSRDRRGANAGQSGRRRAGGRSAARRRDWLASSPIPNRFAPASRRSERKATASTTHHRQCRHNGAAEARKLAFGYELQFFTNHIGHFMLVTGLLDSLKPDGRVVMLSSSAQQMAPKGRNRIRQPRRQEGLRTLGVLWPVEDGESAVRQGTRPAIFHRRPDRQRRSSRASSSPS